jgi:biotin-dependent carboxylase-like uncharacterized protein
MSLDFLQVLSAGFGATIQDSGRPGWRCFGVPPGGAMDQHAAFWANRLLDNPPRAPLLELLWQGASFLVLRDAWVAVTGAEVDGTIEGWRTTHVQAGQQLHFKSGQNGMWLYLAVEGGFHAPLYLGSASVYSRGGFGAPLVKGDVLQQLAPARSQFPAAIAGRFVLDQERRDYDDPPPLRVWRGPQWESFTPADHQAFLESEWMVTSQIDRVGYRLAGPALTPGARSMISEPMRTGTIQVPESGQPIVTMRDGPTVGGYPKLGLIDPRDLSWLAQCRPGQVIRFASAAPAPAEATLET